MPRIRLTPHLKPEPFTKLPNAIIDIYMPKLKDTELRLLLVLIRQTTGWNRHGAEVSLSYKQLSRKTGRASEALANALHSLATMGLIHIRHDTRVRFAKKDVSENRRRIKTERK